MLTSLDNAITQIQQQKKAFINTARQALGVSYKEIFDNFSHVEKIRIIGYTPYFNDGDVCEYRLSEVEVRLAPTGPIDMVCSNWSCKNVVGAADRHCSSCGRKQPTLEERADVYHDYYSLKKSDPTLSTVLESLYRKLRSIQDEIKEIYGDHAKVTIEMVNGQVATSVEEYEHE
jgi:hypothetical protein